MTHSERVWWQHHGQEIVNTMAAPWSSDVVGLLKDDTSYGVKGDHGGAQKPVQRIPIVFYGAGVGSRDSNAPLRSVDIMPTVLRAMGIPGDRDIDGQAAPLPH
jgi:arylsulfatase A-like enzyme